MKKILVHILILIPLIGYSQKYEIPEIAWQEKEETESIYLDLLKIKDRNSLIVKIGYSSYWYKGENSKFIVYQNDGKVKRFVVYQPNSTELKIKVQHKRIKRKNYPHYWEYLEKCVNEGLLQIDKSKLNITKKKGKEEGTVQSMSISDGTNYQFQVFQGKKFLIYESYAPRSYIENTYPGSEERQKLVNLMNGFEQLTEKY